MSHFAKLAFCGLLFGGGLALMPPRQAFAQDQITDSDCTYGTIIVNDKCSGETRRCCKCKLGCPAQ